MKPRILTKCVANNYAAPSERIIEFSGPHGLGGLISFHLNDDGTHMRISLYRLEGNFTIIHQRDNNKPAEGPSR